MKSLLNKRLPGILAAGLVTLAVGAAGVSPAAANDASASGLTASQKKAKSKALKACKKKKSPKAKKACTKKVNKKFGAMAKPKGKTWHVVLGDDYYKPNQMTIKANDSILWSWTEVAGSEPHNVSAFTRPAGVSPFDFESALSLDPKNTFKRQFKVAGDYHFVCSLHTLMTMDVKVTR